jgi:hypothetical protein
MCTYTTPSPAYTIRQKSPLQVPTFTLAIPDLVDTTQNNFIMKKLKFLATCLLFCLLANNLAAQLQQIKIVNFTVKNALPANIDSWTSTPGALVLTAQKSPGTQVREPMMILQIRSGSATICGNTMATAKRIDPFDVRVFNTADLTGLLGNCKELKAGSYTICVQFFNIDKVPVSRELCKEFIVEDAAVEYSPPALIVPDNGKKISAQELQTVMMFRWTPLVPKPKEPVTYRLKVWQLMQGQNGTTAMRTNPPIVTKDVDNITQAAISGILTGPCRPPYLCDFIWSVQALNRNGKPMGNNNGISDPYSFGIAEQEVTKAPALIAPSNNSSLTKDEAGLGLKFRWTLLVPKPQSTVTYRLKVWQLMQGQSGAQAMRTNKPIVTKDVADITEATVSGIYTGPCRPPYLCDYVWNVQALDREGKPIGENEGTSEAFHFGIQDVGAAKPPTLVYPANEKMFSSSEAMQPISFRWTPLVPKPQEPVTYRLKVWQLMQGQNSTQAMRTNKPIVTKDVADITEGTASGIYTGPCRPPYLCDYVWTVQVLDREGKPVGENEGTSQEFRFGIQEAGSAKPPTPIAPANNSTLTKDEAGLGLKFRWTPLVPKPQEPVTYRLKVWQLMQGQSGSQAMRTNPPIVTKDVADITEATVNGIYTGPCKPPYLCDYVWTVQALDRTGNPVGDNEGNSEGFRFGIQEAGSAKPPSLVSPINNKIIPFEEEKKSITFRWTPVVGKPGEHITYRYINSNLAGNTTHNGQAYKSTVTKEVVDVTEITISEIFTGPCKPPYLCEFTWQVQAFGSDGKPIGDNEGKSEVFHYSLKENGETKPPTLLAPANNSSLTKDEAGLGLKFRWTPLVPKPQQPVTYRLKVWQLMQGQNGAQAMRTNKPIVVKDMGDIAEATVSGIYTGPCKPPYLCDFVWTIEALGADGKSLVSKNFQFVVR